MFKIVTVIGARPQFIKAVSVSSVFQKKYASNIQEVIVHTGQHYDYELSDVFFKELKLKKPKYQLGIGSHSQGVQVGRMIEEIEKVLFKEKPNYVLIYGDTNSTLAGALAAKKNNIPVAHVESGMRSFNQRMQEEMNRKMADHVSDILFCSSDVAIQNLKNEGIQNRYPSHFPWVISVGDVMVDTQKLFLPIALKSSFLKNLEVERQSYILSTIHRAENTDNLHKLKTIFTTLDDLSRDHVVLLPLHPRTRAALDRIHFHARSSNFKIIPPVSYLDMLALEKNAKLIMTDSGGVQKEAFLLNIPTVTLRDETEWVETVKQGLNCLTFIDRDEIKKSVQKMLRLSHQVGRSKKSESPYGKGNSAVKIADIFGKLAS